VSRLILGGNLIGGWAHARDLLYVSRLFKEYNTREKIFATLKLCEHAGVNTIVGVPDQLPRPAVFLVQGARTLPETHIADRRRGTDLAAARKRACRTTTQQGGHGPGRTERTGDLEELASIHGRQILKLPSFSMVTVSFR
jgi:hypothetical protein